MLNWGIMATGKIAHQFADTLKGMRDTQRFAAVGGREKESAERFREEYRAVFPDLKAYANEDLVCDPDVQAVYVCSPHACHFADVKSCLEHGKHVLCEKPFTISSAEARELTELAREKNLFLMEGMWIAHLPLIRRMRQIISDGILGDVVYVSADYGYISGGIRLERKLSRELGGGAIMDIGVYSLAFPYLVYGCMPETYASAVRMNAGGTDDGCFSLLTYPGGRVASVSSIIGMIIPNAGQVCGTRGRLYLEDFQEAQTMDLVLNDGTKEHYSEPFPVTGFEYQIENAAKCIAEGRNECELWTWADAVRLQEQVEKVKECWNAEK